MFIRQFPAVAYSFVTISPSSGQVKNVSNLREMEHVMSVG